MSGWGGWETVEKKEARLLLLLLLRWWWLYQPGWAPSHCSMLLASSSLSLPLSLLGVIPRAPSSSLWWALDRQDSAPSLCRGGQE